MLSPPRWASYSYCTVTPFSAQGRKSFILWRAEAHLTLLPTPIPAMPAEAKLPLRFEAIDAGANTDTATKRTIEKMGDYIKAAIADPVVNRAAAFARKHFALGPGEAGLAWAAFWYVKHCVRFRLDEATMFRIGAEDEFDLLTGPDVLVRMKDPAEDCDGFTMLVAALCSIFGLKVFPTTVKVDRDDRDRWSHVFLCAIVDGRVMPLDASHAVGPGWMVNPQNIYGWQSWDLEGNAVDVKPSPYRGLHNYVRVPTRGARYVPTMMPRYRRRGIGQDGESVDTSGIFVDTTPVELPPLTNEPITPWGTPAGPTTTGAPFNWTSFLNNLVGTAGRVASIAETPTMTYRLPDGTIVSGVTPGAAGSTSMLGSLGGTSMLLPIGIGLLALVLLAGGKK